MNKNDNWFTRPTLARTKPDRGAANYYRASSDDGTHPEGIPLDSAEAATVAVVRMAYKVAEAQIDRSFRLAQRLREEGDRVGGPNSGEQALDAYERLVFKALMGILSWIELLGSDPGGRFKKLITAEYQIVGSLLGLNLLKTSELDKKSPSDQCVRKNNRSDSAQTAKAFKKAAGMAVQIKHCGEDRRAVRICACALDNEAHRLDQSTVKFYSVKYQTAPPIEGLFQLTNNNVPLLTINTPQSAPSGRWTAALCDSTGLQLGHLEIKI